MIKEWNIIIGERGWIFAGRTHRDGDKVVIDDAYVVRRFSLKTQDGIGGLAQRGPTKDNDVLDAAPCGVKVGVFAVLADFACDQDAWTTWHAKSKTRVRTK